ncbi:MAG: hypothetical protein ACQESA_03325 [Patescibacteria group bacterium]
MNKQKHLTNLVLRLVNLSHSTAISECVVHYLKEIRREKNLQMSPKTATHIFSEKEIEEKLRLMEIIKREVTEELDLGDVVEDSRNFLVFLKVNFRIQEGYIVRTREPPIPFHQITDDMVERMEKFW